VHGAVVHPCDRHQRGTRKVGRDLVSAEHRVAPLGGLKDGGVVKAGQLSEVRARGGVPLVEPAVAIGVVPQIP
jgi:hypothetical protein